MQFVSKSKYNNKFSALLQNSEAINFYYKGWQEERSMTNSGANLVYSENNKFILTVMKMILFFIFLELFWEIRKITSIGSNILRFFDIINFWKGKRLFIQSFYFAEINPLSLYYYLSSIFSISQNLIHIYSWNSPEKIQETYQNFRYQLSFKNEQWQRNLKT